MNKNVLNTDLSGKVAVVTGAGGVLCSYFAKVLARAGAKVALLDLNYEAANKWAEEIVAEGGVAKAYSCNVLNKEICMGVAKDVMADLGPCDILVNGAGGNNPRATTDKEYFEIGDIDADTKSFFDLDADGVGFVFNLNFLGTLIPTQAFTAQMVGREGCSILNISSMNAFTPLTSIIFCLLAGAAPATRAYPCLPSYVPSGLKFRSADAAQTARQSWICRYHCP